MVSKHFSARTHFKNDVLLGPISLKQRHLVLLVLSPLLCGLHSRVSHGKHLLSNRQIIWKSS